MLETRDLNFDRVKVDFLARGGATVSWAFGILFTDPGPFSCQLQYGETGDPQAADWTNVGAPENNVFSLQDPTQRAFGRQSTAHYRVVVTGALGTYTSLPAHVYGILNRHDWLIAREVVRAESLRLRIGVGLSGWLFKRIHHGATPDPSNPATAVTDYLTGEVTQPRNAGTVGTEFTNGYYTPVPFYVDMSPTSHEEKNDTNRGTVDDAGLVVSGRVIMNPEVAYGDVFVADTSDRRYFFRRIQHVSEWRGVPIVASCELRLAPASDVSYTLSKPS